MAIHMSQRLYVGNLSPGVTEADLRLLFSRIGAVAEVQLNLDPTTRQSRGYGIVTMATPELATAALAEFHGYNFAGRYIAVTEARPPQEPKGLMSEGLQPGPSVLFRPGAQRRKAQRRSAVHSRCRGRHQ